MVITAPCFRPLKLKNLSTLYQMRLWVPWTSPCSTTRSRLYSLFGSFKHVTWCRGTSVAPPTRTHVCVCCQTVACSSRARSTARLCARNLKRSSYLKWHRATCTKANCRSWSWTMTSSQGTNALGRLCCNWSIWTSVNVWCCGREYHPMISRKGKRWVSDVITPVRDTVIWHVLTDRITPLTDYRTPNKCYGQTQLLDGLESNDASQRWIQKLLEGWRGGCGPSSRLPVVSMPWLDPSYYNKEYSKPNQ